MKTINLKKLKKINDIRKKLGYKPYTSDIIEDYVIYAPTSLNDIERNNNNWNDNIINKELLKEINGVPYNKFESTDTDYMVDQIIYENGNRISYPMTEEKIVDLLYWYYCVGNYEHRITIERNGAMKVIHSHHVWVGFHKIENFNDYKIRVFNEIESKVGRCFY